MLSGLLYILQSLLDLYLGAMALRLAMQWVRADYRNPIVQFIVKITDPLVKPLQRMLGRIYKIDMATLVVFLALQWLTVALLASLACLGMPDLLSLFGVAVVRALRTVLNVYFFMIFGYVLLSWVAGGGYNPSVAMVSEVLRQLVQPVMAPVQRLIPPIAGFDLSPVFVLLGLGAVTRALVGPAQQMVAGFSCIVGAIV